MNRRLQILWRAVALTAVGVGLTLPSFSGEIMRPPQAAIGPGGRRPERRARALEAAQQRRQQQQNQQPQEGQPAAQAPTPQPPRPSAQQTAAAGRAPTANSRLELLSGAGGAKTIAMEFYNLDIDHLLRLLSYAAQVTIVKSDQVTGPITVIAPEPVPLDVAFQILDSVLQVRGFTMVKMLNGVYKVVPISEAAQSGLPLTRGTQLHTLPPGDELITQIIPLENLSASDVASQLQGIMPNANIVPTSTNSLIVTDTAANIHRALSLIAIGEEELGGGFRVFRLQYYDASEMSDLVSAIVLGRGGAAAGAIGPRPTWERRVAGRVPTQQRPTPRGQPAVPQAVAMGVTGAGPEFAYPDTRTNSLIVLATPIHLAQIESLIADLDRPVNLRDSYFVYPVQNLVASDLADSIAPLIGAEVTRTGQGGQAGQAGGATARGGAASQRDQRQSYSRPFSQQQGFGRGLSTATSGSLPDEAGRLRAAPAAQLDPLSGEPSPARSGAFMVAQAPEMPPTPQPIPQIEPGAEPPAGEGYPPTAYVTGAGAAEAVIVADDNTNTLLISAPPEQIDLVQQMLERLDVLPPQVHIRAIIAEVTLSRDTSLGFQWQSIGRTWGVFGGDTFTGNIGTNLGVKAPTVSVSQGVRTVSAPSGFFATLSGSEFDAVINALTTDSRARILSAPSIFTSNNQRATVDISQQIPIPTGTFQTSTTAAAGTIATSISYRSVGIVLDVTPRVTQGDVVQMDVSVSADEPGAEVTVGDASYPSINQRLAEATVSVKTGYTVVLGGLMREQIRHNASRIPLLGDLPLIGPFFSQTKDSKEKSELVLFLTPYVVRNPAELAAISERERDRLPEVPKSLRGPLGGAEEQEYLLPEIAPPGPAAEPPQEEPEVTPPTVAPAEEQPPAAPEEAAPALEAPAPEPAPPPAEEAPAPAAAPPTEAQPPAKPQ
ncbi:MAG: type II secretion system secretin GspD [Armatimonadota bacterium]